MQRRRRYFAALVVVAGCVVVGWRYFSPPTRAQLGQSAADAFARNDLAAAEAALLQMTPRDSDVLRLLTDVDYRRGRKKSGVKWLDQRARQ